MKLLLVREKRSLVGQTILCEPFVYGYANTDLKIKKSRHKVTVSSGV